MITRSEATRISVGILQERSPAILNRLDVAIREAASNGEMQAKIILFSEPEAKLAQKIAADNMFSSKIMELFDDASQRRCWVVTILW